MEIKNSAALKLGLSIRQINRLIKIYKEKGKISVLYMATAQRNQLKL